MDTGSTKSEISEISATQTMKSMKSSMTAVSVQIDMVTKQRECRKRQKKIKRQ